jgi:hypothetical protein
MTAGRFNVHLSSRISARRMALRFPPAKAPLGNTHHNRAGETPPSHGVRGSGCARDK